jgi:hypothetical protein
VASGVEQTSGSIETNQQNFGVLGLRLFDGMADDFDGNRMHHSVNIHGEHACRRRLGRGTESERGCH